MRDLLENFIWTVVSCSTSSTVRIQNKSKVTGMVTVKKLINESSGFEDVAKFNWEPMELFTNRRCPCAYVTVCDNHSKCVLNTLYFAKREQQRNKD